MGDVAKGKLPKDAAFDVIGLSAAQYLTILIPIGLFLAVMLALGRLYRDSELPAMMACRVGPSGIYRPLFWLLLPLSVGVAWLSIELGPSALLAIERVGAEARREADLASIEPGRFVSIGPDNAVVYGERILDDGLMENVFLQRRLEDGKLEVVVARLVSRLSRTTRIFGFSFCTKGVAMKACREPRNSAWSSFWSTAFRIVFLAWSRRTHGHERCHLQRLLRSNELSISRKCSGASACRWRPSFSLFSRCRSVDAAASRALRAYRDWPARIHYLPQHAKCGEGLDRAEAHCRLRWGCGGCTPHVFLFAMALLAYQNMLHRRLRL